MSYTRASCYGCFWLLSASIVTLVITGVAGSDVQSLNGDHWRLVSALNKINISATVPGSVHTDLLRASEISDPYYRFNDNAYRWIAETYWNYSSNFEVTEKFLQWPRIDLVCEGLHSISTIYVNGRDVGSSNNMFRRYIFDVKQFLKTGTNTIQINFMSTVNHAAAQSHAYSYDVPPDCPPDVQNGDCHVNFVRTEAASFSWDWGPSFPTMGIWRNISLEGYSQATIRYITAETEYMGNEWSLKLVVFFDVSSMLPGAGVSGTVVINIDELKLVQKQDVTLSDASPSAEINIQINSSYGVKPWWPNGHGAQTLYNTAVAFTANARGSEIDTRNLRVGFRTVELVQDFVNANPPGYTFYFKINGVPLFMKGSNWIPADSFQERITTEYLDILLRSAVDANMNMLRVWGGGVYESDEFYHLADKYGILIWQDFMFACALYPTNKEFLDNVRQEVTHQIRRLKHHPSIAIWSGNNENEGALSENWYGIKDFDRYYKDYLMLYNATIRDVVLKEDQSRPFVMSSPSNGRETETEGWVAKDPQSTRYGDTHFYNYDIDTWNWTLFPVPRFASEFGLQSWCSLETLGDVSVTSDLDMDSDFVQHRQHHDTGNEQLLNETILHMKLPTSNNATQRFGHFIYLTQINQAMGMKTEVELYRRSQSALVNAFEGFTMGALYWQLNDIWQAPTWASIEYGGTWKMLHYYAKRFFNQALISPYLDGDQLVVYYVNDLINQTVDVINNNNDVMDHDDDVTQQNSDKTKYIFHPQHKARSFGKAQANEQSQSVHRFVNSKDDNDGSLLLENKRGADRSVLMTILCYKWSNMVAPYKWTVALNISSQHAAQSVFTSPLSRMLKSCQCASVSECFLYFTGLDSNSQLPAFPDNFLLLDRPSSAVGLQKANILITEVTLLDKTTVEIQLSTDRVAPFVWLTAAGFKGHFSDNGFLLVHSNFKLLYQSWKPISDLSVFLKNLSVQSLMDVYA